MSDEMDRVILSSGQILKVHASNSCRTWFCPIHQPSPHHMITWTQFWREDRALMERICPHGIGHPDPDDLKSKDEYESIHSCDGCCVPPTREA